MNCYPRDKAWEPSGESTSQPWRYPSNIQGTLGQEQMVSAAVPCQHSGSRIVSCSMPVSFEVLWYVPIVYFVLKGGDNSSNLKCVEVALDQISRWNYRAIKMLLVETDGLDQHLEKGVWVAESPGLQTDGALQEMGKMPLETEQQELLLGWGTGLPALTDSCHGVGHRKCTE